MPAWVFTHLETRIQPEAAWNRVGFSTYFQEKVLVVTDFPNGEHIETPNYQSHTIVTGLDDAYAHHLQQVAGYSRTFGPPHPIRSMADYLKWEKVGRQQYATRKLMRWVRTDLVRLSAFVYGVLVLVLTPILYPAPAFFSIPAAGLYAPQERMLYVMILLLLPAIFLPRFFERLNLLGTYKDSRLSK
jgi:hypothetical protein